MTTLIEDNRVTNGTASLKIKMKMLEQMAEALEDEASSLYRRAAAFEEEGFLLNREIEERQTEINRLQMKLDSLYSERDSLIERIEGIESEASAMREEIFNSEEEIGLALLEEAKAKSEMADADPDNAAFISDRETPGDSLFFNRMKPGSYIP